jgi:hypothetical protein
MTRRERRPGQTFLSLPAILIRMRLDPIAIRISGKAA